MIEALNMQLESVRTVLKNEVNEISVCADLKRGSGVFYTVISIVSASVRRQVAGMAASGELFSRNSDFIGSFTYGDAFNLVFLYRSENLLIRRETMYASDFVKRRQLVERLLVALAETQLTGSIGLLLLDERNLNVSPDAGIYLNYFLDFSRWNPDADNTRFFAAAALTAFEILSRDYQTKYDGNVANYPSELRVLQKKAMLHGFTSFNSILTFVKTIPDKLSEPAIGFKKLLERIKDMLAFLQRHSMTLFLILIVIVTIFYAGFQLISRMSYRSLTQRNTTYVGLDTIGDIYLGDENV